MSIATKIMWLGLLKVALIIAGLLFAIYVALAYFEED